MYFILIIIIFIYTIFIINKDLVILERAKPLSELIKISKMKNCEFIIIEEISLTYIINIMKKYLTLGVQFYYYNEKLINNNKYMEILKELNITYLPCKVSIDNDGNKKISTIN